MNTATLELSDVKNHKSLCLFFSTLCLCIPIILFSIFNYDINPAFLLAPIICFAAIKVFDRLTVVYIIAAVAGIGSVLIAHAMVPDGEITRHLMGLILILFSPALFFLGRYLRSVYSLAKVYNLLALFSSVFLLCICGRLLILAEPVRISVNDFSLMNAVFLGVPVFASFGILSLANLILIQTIIITGALLSPRNSLSLLIVFYIAAGCGIFMLVGSDSRSSQVIVIFLVASIIANLIKQKNNRKRLYLLLITLCCAGFFSSQWSKSESRLMASIESIKSIGSGHKVIATEQLDSISSGRIVLIKTALSEVADSMIVGNGFSGFGRMTSENKKMIVGDNTSTHIYYLTLIWKGGLLFCVPLFIFFFMAMIQAARGSKGRLADPFYWFTWTAVAAAFGPMCFAWDLLMVPSAGALSFFLLGTLAITKKSERDRTSTS